MLSDDNSNISRCRDSFSEQVSDTFGQSICEGIFDAASNCVSMMEAAQAEAEIKQTAIRVMLAEIRLII